ncbi:hypothetical protein DCC79_14585 [bacterium]|nr:MAG: hypothetical protein DCC79_14585 [bacterium]
MSPPRRAGLAVQIVAWSFVPTAIILIAVALVSFMAYRQVTADLAVAREEEVTRLSASQLAAGLTDFVGTLDAVARALTAAGPSAVERRATLDRARNRLVVFDAGVVLLDSHGVVTHALPRRSDLVGQAWSGQPFFQELVRRAEPVFSDALTIGGVPVIALGVPVLGEQGQLAGVLAGMFRLGATEVSAFYGSIVRLRLGESGALYVVDQAGRVLYHSDSDRIGADYAGLAAVRSVVGGEAGALRTRDVEGRDIVAGFAPVPGTPWGLVNEEQWSTLLEPSRRWREFLIGLLALGVLVPALVTAVGVRRITRPIRDLTNAARAVAGGDFDQSLTVRTGNEIEDLAAQFNDMARQLAASYGELEQRVALLLADAQRTAAIVERQRLARELHDSVTQSLYSLTLLAAAGQRLATSGDGAADRLPATLERLSATAQQALKEMRLLVFELRPLELETEGFVGAVRRRLEAVEQRAGLRAELVAPAGCDIDEAIEGDLYRIVQELLNNTLKHAGATAVSVRLTCGRDATTVEVADDGRGFDPAAVAGRGGLGLTSIRERAAALGAELVMDAAPRGGTRVRVTVPRVRDGGG